MFGLLTTFVLIATTVVQATPVTIPDAVAYYFFPTKQIDNVCSRYATPYHQEGCDHFGARESVSFFQLLYVNPNVHRNCDNLPESNICIGYVDQDCTSTYPMRWDEDCDTVADKFRIDRSVVRANNGWVCNQGNHHDGTVLCISPYEIPYDH